MLILFTRIYLRELPRRARHFPHFPRPLLFGDSRLVEEVPRPVHPPVPLAPRLRPRFLCRVFHGVFFLRVVPLLVGIVRNTLRCVRVWAGVRRCGLSCCVLYKTKKT